MWALARRCPDSARVRPRRRRRWRPPRPAGSMLVADVEAELPARPPVMQDPAPAWQGEAVRALTRPRRGPDRAAPAVAPHHGPPNSDHDAASPRRRGGP